MLFALLHGVEVELIYCDFCFHGYYCEFCNWWICFEIRGSSDHTGLAFIEAYFIKWPGLKHKIDVFKAFILGNLGVNVVVYHNQCALVARCVCMHVGMLFVCLHMCVSFMNAAGLDYHTIACIFKKNFQSQSQKMVQPFADLMNVSESVITAQLWSVRWPLDECGSTA